MKQVLQWVENRRTLATFARAGIYIALILILPKPTGHEKDFVGSAIAGAYTADFGTWFVYSLLKIATNYKDAGLKAIPNVIAGIIIYKAMNISLSSDSMDIGTAFVPFMLVLVGKAMYYTLTWDGIIDDAGDSDEGTA